MTMRSALGFTALATAALALAACTPAEENPSEATTDTTASTTAPAETTTGETAAADAPVTIEDGVVRAKGNDNDMTSIFGTLVNHTDENIDVTGFTADLEATSFELHEVVNGVMQEKEGGFTIAPGSTHELAPGGDHLMVMGHPGEIPAGDTVKVSLLLGDGIEVALDPVPVRTIGAGDENYGGDGQLQGHGMHDQGH